MTATPLDVVGSIRYLTLLLADQPRRIDTVINYFGSTSSDSDPRPTRWEMRARRDGRRLRRTRRRPVLPDFAD